MSYFRNICISAILLCVAACAQNGGAKVEGTKGTSGTQGSPATAATPAASTTPAADAAATAAPVVVDVAGADTRVQGALHIQGVPEIPNDLHERLMQFQNVRRANLLDWHPDGWMLIATRFGNAPQLHRVNAPGADRTQLTFYDEPLSSGSITND